MAIVIITIITITITAVIVVLAIIIIMAVVIVTIIAIIIKAAVIIVFIGFLIIAFIVINILLLIHSVHFKFIHSFVKVTSILPLQVHYYSEALPTTARILHRSFTPKRHRQLRVKDLPNVPTWRLERNSNPRPFGRKASNLLMSTTTWSIRFNIAEFQSAYVYNI